MTYNDNYRPLAGTINIVAEGIAPSPSNWAQRHTDLMDYTYSTAAALWRFECGRCFVEYEPPDYRKLIYPKFRITPMAKKSTKKDSSVGNWNGIANVPFNSAEKEQFMKWQAEAEDWEIDLQDLIAQDYKLSLSHDNRSGAVMASLSCYNPKEPNYKYTLISRAPTPLMAVAVTLFKHLVLSEGNWIESTPEDADLWG